MGASIAFLIMGIDFGPIATQIYLKRHWLLFSFVAPDATQLGEHTVTQKHLYLGLFVIGIPLVWFADPFGTVFWIIGASAVLILVHASIMEPGVESEYASIDGETVWMAGDADLLDPHHPFNSSLFISGPLFCFLFFPLLSFNKLFLGISVPDNLLYMKVYNVSASQNVGSLEYRKKRPRKWATAHWLSRRRPMTICLFQFTCVIHRVPRDELPLCVWPFPFVGTM